jgi:MTA/SAH nucleosidase
MIGIIGAMEEEITNLKSHMQVDEVQTIAGMSFFKGAVKGTKLVLVRSGIGKVNAGICTQILASVYGVDTVINTGIAGSLNADIDIGDIVVSTSLVQYDVDARNFGYKLGEIPRMNIVEFPADKYLIDKTQSVFDSLGLGIKLYKGMVATGDKFVSEDSLKAEIISNFHAYCVEMEGAAIAQAAMLNNMACVVIRAISDKADNSADVDYRSFEAKAIENMSKISLALVDSLK